MSDPVTNVEIEDVLSSIRKLVAEEARPPLVAPKKAAQQDRLVLTSAQRVDTGAEETAAQTADAAPDELFRHRPIEERAIEEIPKDARLSEFGDVEGAFPDIEDIETEDTSALNHDEIAVDSPDGDAAAEETAPLALTDLIEEEVASVLGMADTAPAEPAEADTDEEFGEPNVMLADAVDAASQDAEFARLDEPDSALEDAFDDFELEPALAEDTAPDAELPSPEPDDETAVDADPEPQGQDEPPMTLEAKVAALGRLVARGSGDFEEDREAASTQGAVESSAAMAWAEEDLAVPESEPDLTPTPDMAVEEELAEPSVIEEAPAIQESSAVASAPAEDAPASEEAEQALPENDAQEALVPPAAPVLQIDEDVLRGMVGEIVRQELQGALGERITRNVRKLVRREIHRMLISQELD